MRINHVTIMSSCMEESIAFYERFAGLKIIRDLRNGSHGVVFLAEKEGDTCIEIADNPEMAYSGHGISIGFPVDDIDAKKKELEDAGLVTTAFMSPNPHVRFFFVNDPNGVTVQFIKES